MLGFGVYSKHGQRPRKWQYQLSHSTISTSEEVLFMVTQNGFAPGHLSMFVDFVLHNKFFFGKAMVFILIKTSKLMRN